MIEFSDDLIARLRVAKHVVAYTGAGISAESGIPTFRDPKSGLWERYSAEQIATADGFQRDPELVWGWYAWRRLQVERAQPNAAHLALAKIEGLVPKMTVITQNVDNLHERSGSSKVIHVHGSLFACHCFDCDSPYTEPVTIPPGTVDGAKLMPPRCLACGGLIRPSVVWFGDRMIHETWEAAMHATEREGCDVFFCVGASLAIYPAAELPFESARQGATVIQVNPEVTKLDEFASFNLHEAAGAVLPRLVERCWPAKLVNQA